MVLTAKRNRRNHLAQAFEGLDRNADALWMYRLAKQADHAADAKQDFAEVAAAIARLEKAGSRRPAASTLQYRCRTFAATT